MENSDLVTWDKPAALERMRGKAERLVRLCELFKQGSIDDVSEFYSALARNDFPTAQRVAHTLKGVAAHLSAERLRALALELERAAEREDLASLNELSPKFDRAIMEFVAEIDVFLESVSKPE